MQMVNDSRERKISCIPSSFSISLFDVSRSASGSDVLKMIPFQFEDSFAG
jgi:hypothetical protein